MLSKYQTPLTIFGAVLLPNVGGWAGGLITRTQIKPWYEGLQKPEWRPPNWAFGPAWTTIYCGLGYASYIVYRDTGGFDGKALAPMALYGSNLLLNWAWTPIFFGLHSLKGGLAEILALDVNTIILAYTFYKVNKTAGLLLAPYLLWLGLATALNYVVVRDNNDDSTPTPSKKD